MGGGFQVGGSHEQRRNHIRSIQGDMLMLRIDERSFQEGELGPDGGDLECQAKISDCKLLLVESLQRFGYPLRETVLCYYFLPFKASLSDPSLL